MSKRFTLKEFRDWLSNQDDMTKFFNLGMGPQDNTDSYIGKKVVARVSENKLLQRIKCDDDPQTVVQDFIEHGGEIVAVDGKMFYIEGTNSNFYIPRFCVRGERV